MSLHQVLCSSKVYLSCLHAVAYLYAGTIGTCLQRQILRGGIFFKGFFFDIDGIVLLYIDLVNLLYRFLLL
jgi:hypothetical protein